MTLPFEHPSTIVLSGPSSSGKTWFTKKLLQYRNEMFSKVPNRVIWCYSEYQQAYQDVEGVEFHEGLFNLDTLDTSQNTVIIYDDLADSEATYKEMVKIFTKKSHHRNMSVVFITQNLFSANKYSRTISLNASYVVLMKSPRDKLQIMHLARQVYPKNFKFMIEAYVDATSDPHSYLLIDFKQSTPEQYRLRAKIFPDELTAVYVSRG